MKKYIFLWALIAAISCSPDNSYKPATHEWVGIKKPTKLTTTEDSGVPITMNLYTGGELTNAASFDVPYTITGGTYGTDYTVVGGSSASGTVTIPAGDLGTVAFNTIKITPVANSVKEANKVLTVTLGTPTDSKIAVGYPLLPSIDVTIVDDDCSYVEADYIKTAQGRETYSPTGCYPSNCTSTYPVVMTKTATNTLSTDNFWDSGWVINIVVDPATNTVTIPTQSPATGVTVSGSGTIATCSKTMTFSTHIVWPAQSYDDTNTNIYKF